MNALDKAVRYVEKNPEIPTGAVLGAAVGLGESIANVGIGCIQLALYPLYMANCAVKPFVRIISPVIIMPVYTVLGTLCGVGWKAGKEFHNK